MVNVQLIAPESSGSMYFNHRGTFSIVLLGVANTNYNFIYAAVGCQGRISDGGVFKYTSLYEKIEERKKICLQMRLYQEGQILSCLYLLQTMRLS